MRPDGDDLQEILGMLLAGGPEGPSMERRIELAQLFRRNRERSSRLDQALIGDLLRLREGLEEARHHQEEMRSFIRSLVMPPLFTATLVRLIDTATDGPRAIVAHAGGQRVVSIADDVNPGDLFAGDEVYLAEKLNVIVGVAPYGPPQHGECAVFDRWAGEGRAVVRSREEELVVHIAGRLRDLSLSAGDHLRWDRATYMAFEKLERSNGNQLFLEGTPAETFACLGGLDRQIAVLQHAFLLRVQHAETVARYGVPMKRSALLHGPSGTGKTLFARALCNWLGKRSPAGEAFFMYIKPSSLHSVWYSKSEENYREVFRIAREAAAAHPGRPVVLYFDEVDSIGTARGESSNRVDDRISNTVMSELDGLEARGDVFILASTNRRTALDPAFLRPGRLGDLIIEIPRPNRLATQAILNCHLPEFVPFSGPREAAVGAVASYLFTPNGLGELATLVFRDGKRQALRAADLISGADVAKIAAEALDRACRREVETGSVGVRGGDLIAAAEQQLRTIASGITARNCHHHVQGLPEDVDVVSVLRTERKVVDRRRFLNAA